MKIKELLVEAPVLIHYDATKPLRIQCEASLDGFGACLLQEGKPIAYASRTLIDAEKRYANIERELCAIVYAVEKFNYLVYGREVIINTDHKPLVNIFKKNINKISTRLQRLMYSLLSPDVQYVGHPDSSVLLIL